MTQAPESTREGGSALEQAAGTAREKGQEFSQRAGGRLREEVDQRSTEAGEQIRSLGDAVRRTGQQLRTEDKTREANMADQAAQRVERLADYLAEADADRILSDLERLARQRPWFAVAAGAAVGFAASRLLKASSGRRFEQQREYTQRQGRAEVSAQSTASPQ